MSSLVTTRPAEVWPGPTQVLDPVACEEPLEIRAEGEPLAITLRTPGHDLELVAGFLFAEGLITHRDDLAALAEVPGSPNLVDLRWAGGVRAHLRAREQLRRTAGPQSACGVCGAELLARLRTEAPRPARTFTPAPEVLLGLADRMPELQPGHQASGGLHAAAQIAPDGEVRLVREDVGRHNAVDKLVGRRLLDDHLPLSGDLLWVSSRAGFEIVQKAWRAGFPWVVTVGPPTSLAIDAAQEAGIGLLSWLRTHRFVRYA